MHLATLASLVEIPEGKLVKPFRVGRRENPAYCYEIEVETIKDPWYSQIFQYLKHGEVSFPVDEDGKLLNGVKAKSLQALKRLAAQFAILGDDLYKKRDGIPHSTVRQRERSQDE